MLGQPQHKWQPPVLLMAMKLPSQLAAGACQPLGLLEAVTICILQSTYLALYMLIMQRWGPNGPYMKLLLQWLARCQPTWASVAVAASQCKRDLVFLNHSRSGTLAAHHQSSDLHSPHQSCHLCSRQLSSDLDSQHRNSRRHT
mgnify:CR=1 FL=1